MPYLSARFGNRLPSIPLKDGLVVGRESDALSRYPEELRDRLEHEHLRFRMATSGWTVKQLSGADTARVNGSSVDDAGVPLADGDVVELAEGFTFEFRGDGFDPDATQIHTTAASRKLLLKPRSKDGPQSPLVIDRFPFLISKSSGAFGRYLGDCPLVATFVSRHHAQFFAMGEHLYIEDLGSTNGTTLNSRPVGSNPQAVACGDLVCFGHDALTFEIQIADATAARSAEPIDVEGTVMISSARSFLDVYVNAAAPRAGALSSGDGVVAGAGKLPYRLPWLAHWPVLDRCVQSVGRWWRDLPVGRDIRLYISLGAPILLLLLVMTVLLQDRRPDRAETLLAEDRPGEALALASEYLAEYPDHDRMRAVAEEALENHLLAGWTEHMRRSEVADASAFVSDSLALLPGGVSSRLPDLLRWMSDLASYRNQRDPDHAASLVTGNETMRSLLRRWETHSGEYEPLLIELSERSSGFALLNAAAMSFLRVLQDDSRILLGAIDRLYARLGPLLDTGRFSEALAEVETFQLEFPRVAGVDVLLADLRNYLALSDYSERMLMRKFIDAASGATFSSRFVRQRAEPLLAEAREAAPLLDRLDASVRTWKRGFWADAIDQLDNRPDTRWASPLAEKQQRYSRLIDRFQALLELVQTPEYPGALIEFYTRLDPVEDQFLYDVLRDDFANHQQHAREKAASLAEKSVDLWSRYGARYDGISGGLRLESEISQAYRDQAQLLHRMMAATEQAVHINTLLDTPPPEELAQIRSQVVAEVQRQRLAFESLRTIIGDELVDAKLALLPDPAGGRDA